MIEAMVDKGETQGSDPESLLDETVGVDITAEVVPGKQEIAGDNGVTGAFETIRLGQVNDPVAPSAEPSGEILLLTGTLPVTEPAGDKGPVPDQAGVGGETHVRETGSGPAGHDPGADLLLEDLPEVPPLPDGPGPALG